MTLERCDRCGVVSPTPDHLHIANHWTDCFQRPRYGRQDKRVVLCTDCWDRAIEPPTSKEEGWPPPSVTELPPRGFAARLRWIFGFSHQKGGADVRP